MKILKILEGAELILVDLQVKLGDELRNAPTLCVRYNNKIKIGTHIINVAASGETPNISATKSLIALIINFSYSFCIFVFL